MTRRARRAGLDAATKVMMRIDAVDVGNTDLAR